MYFREVEIKREIPGYCLLKASRPLNWNLAISTYSRVRLGFLGGTDSKESVCNMGDQGSIPGSGRSPGEGNGNPLWYSCLKNPMDRGAWQATVHGVAKRWTGLSN